MYSFSYSLLNATHSRGNRYSVTGGNCISCFCLPSGKRFTLNGKTLHKRSKFFLFRVDPFLETGITKALSQAKTAGTVLRLSVHTENMTKWSLINQNEIKMSFFQVPLKSNMSVYICLFYANICFEMFQAKGFYYNILCFVFYLSVHSIKFTKYYMHNIV